MSKSRSAFRRRLLTAGIATATAATAITAFGTPAHANAPLTLSATSASVTTVGAGLTVVATSTTAWLSSATSTSAKVFFSTAACPTSYPASLPSTATAASDVTKLSNFKGYFAVPTSLAPTATTAYKVCAYAGTTSGDTYIGTAAFTVSPTPTVTGDVSPVNGPASGGTIVTVTGTNFPTTAAGFQGGTIGGVAIPTITPVSATKFTFVTPPKGASSTAQDLVINTATAGQITKSTAFTFYNSITVTPNSAVWASTTAPDTPISITGAGFNSLTAISTASSLPNTATAHVFLSESSYDPTGSSNTYTNEPITECQPTSVIVINDTELLCTLKLTKTLNATGTTQAEWTAAGATPVGAYVVSVVANSTVGANAATASASAVTPGAVFTVSSY